MKYVIFVSYNELLPNIYLSKDRSKYGIVFVLDDEVYVLVDNPSDAMIFDDIDEAKSLSVKIIDNRGIYCRVLSSDEALINVVMDL